LPFVKPKDEKENKGDTDKVQKDIRERGIAAREKGLVNFIGNRHSQGDPSRDQKTEAT
jgi:hypothetical protein